MMDGEAPTTMAEADAALVAPETPEAAPAAEPTGQPTEGQARDEQGRFTQAPKAAPDPSPEEPAPAPETPAEPTASAEPAAEAPADYPAFSYRADGQEFPVPGSAVGEDGVFIPKDQLPEVQQLLSAGKAAMGSVRQRLNEAAQREQAAILRAEAAEVQGQHILAHFEQLIEQSQHVQDWAQSPAALWLQQAAINWPVLKAEAKAAGIEKQREADRQALERYQQQEQQARLRPIMEQTLEQGVQHFGRQAGLGETALRDVIQALKDPRWEAVVFPAAPYDDPAQGIKQGDRVIDYGVVQEWVRRAVTWGAGRQTPAATPKPAAKPVTPAAVPPTVATKGKAPKSGPAIPAFKTKEEADAWFERGGYMDLDLD